jgi:hypothetical protein
MREGVPAYFSRAVRDVLNNTYNGRRTNRGGPTTWTPHPSASNPLDFQPWGHVKTLVYATPDDKEEGLHLRTEDAYQTIRNYVGILGRMRRFMMRLVEGKLKPHGVHFEHL